MKKNSAYYQRGRIATFKTSSQQITLYHITGTNLRSKTQRKKERTWSNIYILKLYDIFTCCTVFLCSWGESSTWNLLWSASQHTQGREKAERQTGRLTDWQANRQKDRQAGMQTGRKTDRNRQAGKQKKDRKKEWKTERQTETGRQANRKKDRMKDRETNIHKDWQTHRRLDWQTDR